jgi:hypothetical protein
MPDTDLHEHIKWHAYRLWEQEGRPQGRADDHWLRAEAEVTGGNSSAEVSPGAAEHTCPTCGGTGRRGRGRCKNCGGTGRIVGVPEPLT